ncbi:hypothetical protein GCM10010350_79140 [Streptomyces galilaeus]|nr:hypothetical protein GCM10010350_79140 [Streptomyces galilaeus]
MFACEATSAGGLTYGRVDLLRIDELGYMELDRRGAELLFQVLTEREEKNSVAIASNESFWVDEDVHGSAALRGRRRPADLQRRDHPDWHRVLPARPYEGGGQARRSQLTGRAGDPPDSGPDSAFSLWVDKLCGISPETACRAGPGGSARRCAVCDTLPELSGEGGACGVARRPAYGCSAMAGPPVSRCRR